MPSAVVKWARTGEQLACLSGYQSQHGAKAKAGVRHHPGRGARASAVHGRRDQKRADIATMTDCNVAQTHPSIITVKDVKDARQAWCDAVRSRDTEAVTALYEPGAELLGTFDTSSAGIRRKGTGKVREYFDHFLSCEELIPTFHDEVCSGHSVPSSQVTHSVFLECQVCEKDLVRAGPAVVHSGFYDFALVQAGEKFVAHAKFTFVYRRPESAGHAKQQLLIAVHNSGLTPQGSDDEEE